ncbi:autorepressor SdpR family transcription factor [Parablautia intestinalis]|uniref:autorepressor SdpR family transcription factor n=1 Tax=Parablautia intestinalis TaxID=2320100 RepID=UPI00259CEF1E|nr:autorepressor SdpR family transcription factor [Parablautia intestinalis]
MDKILKAVSDPTRREILQLLKNGRKSAGEISNKFSISDAAISKHLSILKEANLVRTQRQGKYIFYEINLSVVEEIITWFANFF